MIARLLLILSSAFGILLGVGFIAVSIYAANSGFVSNLADKIDLSSLPKAEEMKRNIVEKFEKSGIIQTIASVFLATGIIVLAISALGLVSAITASAIIIIIYLVFNGLLMAGFLISLILVTGARSVVEEPIIAKLVNLQNSKFVSVVSLVNNEAGDGILVTAAYNFLQLKFACCGMRSVGDTRDSPRWRSSPRGLAALLKLRSWDSGRRRRSLSSDPNLPDWIRDRIPPGATLPPGLALPDKLPAGVRIPSNFNVSLDMLSNVSAVRQLFEDSLVLETPITCCRFKNPDSVMSFNVETLVANMVNPDCPFRSVNTDVNSETCFQKLINLVQQYSMALIISGIIVGLMLSCNLALACQILICS